MKKVEKEEVKKIDKKEVKKVEKEEVKKVDKEEDVIHAPIIQLPENVAVP